MRKLTQIEEQRLAALTAQSVQACLIEPTETALKKSIMDATMPVRRYLSEMQLHDFDNQKQGGEHKILINAQLINDKNVIESRASLYRPTTKKGDPRIWFKGLPSFSQPNDILALIAFQNEIYVLNLTQLPLMEIINKKKAGSVWDLLQTINQNANLISDELLSKIKRIAQRGLVKSTMETNASTGIGRTLETMLGIEINSSKEPDYKGIELKSYRIQPKGKQNRKTLFAQVPNWKLSKFKSSREILENFGYDKNNEFRLYCTLSTQSKNPQGLQLVLDQSIDQLIETSEKTEIGEFAIWLMEDLRNRLLTKHNETFWVAANSQHIDSHEYFEFTKVLHTRKPIASQFDILIEQGAITVDHLIKRKTAGSVSEKGPLFKIDSNALEMLFPPSITYNLN